MDKPNSLPPEALCRVCDPAMLDFETTDDLPELMQVIGQDRAVEAIRFGIGIRRPGFNIYALGPTGTGKTTVVRQFLDPQAKNEQVPSDWAYINNFVEAHKPRALRLPPGRAIPLREDLDHLIQELKVTIPAAFESEEYRTRKDVIDEEFKGRQEKAFEALQAQAKDKNIALIRTPMGIAFAPTLEGKVITPEQFERLPESDRERMSADLEQMQSSLQALFHEGPKWEREHRERVRELNRDLTKYAVSHLIDEIRERWRGQTSVPAYLDAVEQDVIDNAATFLVAGTQDGTPRAPIAGLGGPSASDDPLFRRYRVNVLVSHDTGGGAPVIQEDHPTVGNLLGRIEHIAEYGALITDFNLIKPGALHRANGGYLLLEARRLLLQPFAWEELKRSLRAREIRIESLGQMLSLVSTVSIEPEPIPLDIKIILVGDRLIYYLLSAYDPDFQELFKVPADFADDADLNPDNVKAYARLIGSIARKESLRPLDRAAVARTIEQAARIAADSEKLSMHIESLSDLLRESDHWASVAGRSRVQAEDVRKAVASRDYRSDRVRARIQEEIHRGTILIDTLGAKVGQVNGLSVIELGGFAFGRPSRITARVRLGRGQVIDIEREVELGGPLHSKGVLILSNFLAARFATERPLSLSASLVFEQSYGGIEGDSASSAELYALISALSNLPIDQSLAVTGSVNQFGEIQAIGGVNEKIEGFFDVCAARGLTGGHGVLIPSANIKHLMLREDVVAAARAGKFHIHAVTTIDQGMEILTGRATGTADAQGRYPADSINGLVEQRLEKFIGLGLHYARAMREDKSEERP